MIFQSEGKKLFVLLTCPKLSWKLRDAHYRIMRQMPSYKRLERGYLPEISKIWVSHLFRKRPDLIRRATHVRALENLKKPIIQWLFWTPLARSVWKWAGGKGDSVKVTLSHIFNFEKRLYYTIHIWSPWHVGSFQRRKTRYCNTRQWYKSHCVIFWDVFRTVSLENGIWLRHADTPLKSKRASAGERR